MSIIVQKYGGTSVSDIDRIRAVGERVIAARRAGHEVVVVVSAMGHSTDELLAMAHRLTPMPNPRELDLLLTAGERIAMSLLAIAVNSAGFPAASYTGSQAGIITDTRHGRARIIDIRPGRIREALDRGAVVIVAGFQGVSTAYDVTTLGRGGSDTTAVALAAALGAEACEIYTDVSGVYTADPRIVPQARKLHAVSYEEMLEMAASGAGVLQLRAVEYARGSGVMLHVRSSFSEEDGTWVREEDERMEQAMISGVVHDTSEAKITVEEVPDRPGIAAAIFRAVADEGIGVDTIVQNVSRDGRSDVSFTVPKDDLGHARTVMEQVAPEVGAQRYTADDGIAKVSLVGAGMKSHPGVQADMFSALADADINIEMISTSSIRITCVIRAADVDGAVRALHERFALSDEAVVREH
ncbi:MAG TPA: aspartate kinase [Actinomycetota bacterium]|nr:aspartate kinase [Actinomycetota bacterium]